MGICGWLVFGFIAGLIARAVMPGDQPMGFFKTSFLGIAGSFVGGFIASLVFGGSWNRLQATGLLGSILGAIVILWVGQMTRSRR